MNGCFEIPVKDRSWERFTFSGPFWLCSWSMCFEYGHSKWQAFGEEYVRQEVTLGL
jgi:hypothetical protein